MANKPGMTPSERIAAQQAQKKLDKIKMSVRTRQRADIRNINERVKKIGRASAFQKESGRLSSRIKELTAIKSEVDRFAVAKAKLDKATRAAARADQIKKDDTARRAFRKAEHIATLSGQVSSLEAELGMKAPPRRTAAWGRVAGRSKYGAVTAAGRKVSGTAKKGKVRRRRLPRIVIRKTTRKRK